jgi:hypothetical protein
VFSLDTTGLNDGQIADIVESLYPAANKREGTYAILHTTELTGAQVTGIDVGAVTTKHTVMVDVNGVYSTQSVLRDVTFTDASGTVTVAVTRGRKRFVVNGTNQWVFDQNLSLGYTP